MRKVFATAVAILFGGLLIGGCTGNNFRDIEGVKSQEPDSIEVFSNVDKHPNIAKLCIDGVAFATTTREGNSAIMRVEAWDTTCPAAKKG
jgi:hypothetical protein